MRSQFAVAKLQNAIYLNNLILICIKYGIYNLVLHGIDCRIWFGITKLKVDESIVINLMKRKKTWT